MKKYLFISLLIGAALLPGRSATAAPDPIPDITEQELESQAPTAAFVGEPSNVDGRGEPAPLSEAAQETRARRTGLAGKAQETVLTDLAMEAVQTIPVSIRWVVLLSALAFVRSRAHRWGEPA